MALFLAMFVNGCTILATLQEVDGAAGDNWLYRVFGFSSTDSLATAMLVLFLTYLGTFFVLALYQAIMTQDAPMLLRLKSTNQEPLLSLGRGKRYHLFLSHGLSAVDLKHCTHAKRRC